MKELITLTKEHLAAYEAGHEVLLNTNKIVLELTKQGPVYNYKDNNGIKHCNYYFTDAEYSALKKGDEVLLYDTNGYELYVQLVGEQDGN